VPSVEGQYKVTIKYASKDIPKCPYVVNITKPGDSKKVVVQGPGVEKTGVQVNRKTYFEVTTKCKLNKQSIKLIKAMFDSSVNRSVDQSIESPPIIDN